MRPTKTTCYVEIPPTDPHQEELDENALNEAIEARLMEIIASSPALEEPVTFTVGSTEIVATHAQDPFDPIKPVVPGQIRTGCQVAECQVA